LKGKTVYVFATRGGRYAGTPLDTETSFVRDFLHFVGIDDVQFVYSEGLALGEEPKQAGLAEASKLLASLASAYTLARAA
jgi:FMN-dependent NADH-azoreductase